VCEKHSPDRITEEPAGDTCRLQRDHHVLSPFFIFELWGHLPILFYFYGVCLLELVSQDIFLGIKLSSIVVDLHWHGSETMHSLRLWTFKYRQQGDEPVSSFLSHSRHGDHNGPVELPAASCSLAARYPDLGPYLP
jgi:hypothetical protein